MNYFLVLFVLGLTSVITKSFGFSDSAILQRNCQVGDALCVPSVERKKVKTEANKKESNSKTPQVNSEAVPKDSSNKPKKKIPTKSSSSDRGEKENKKSEQEKSPSNSDRHNSSNSSKNPNQPPKNNSCSFCKNHPNLVKEIFGKEPLPCWKTYFENLIDPEVSENQIRISYRNAVKCFDNCLNDSDKEMDLDFLVNECMDWTPFRRMRECQKLAIRFSRSGPQNLSEETINKIYKKCPENYIEFSRKTAEITGCTLSKKINGAIAGKYKGWASDENGQCIAKFGSPSKLFKNYIDHIALQVNKQKTRFMRLESKCIGSPQEAEFLKEIVEKKLKDSSTNLSVSMKDFIPSGEYFRWSSARIVCGYWLNNSHSPRQKLVFRLKCSNELNCDMEDSDYNSSYCMHYGRKKVSNHFEIVSSCGNYRKPHDPARHGSDGIAYDFLEMPLGNTGVYIHYAFDVTPGTQKKNIRYIGLSYP